MTGQDISFQATKSMHMSYEKSFSISSSYTVIKDNKPTLSASLYFSSNGMNFQAEIINMFAKSSLVAMAGKNASYGAEHTGISGYGD